jgi:hypothetical protein
MRTLTTIKGREIRGYRFLNLANANGWANGSATPMRVMLGDIDLHTPTHRAWFWVVTPADAARLERAGYEYAN